MCETKNLWFLEIFALDGHFNLSTNISFLFRVKSNVIALYMIIKISLPPTK